MESYKINTQKFEIAETPEAAGKAAKNLGKFLVHLTLVCLFVRLYYRPTSTVKPLSKGHLGTSSFCP